MSENRQPAEATQSLGILSLVHARGRHADLGFQVGRDRADQVRRMVETYRRLFRDRALSWHSRLGGGFIARRYLPFVEGALPQYIDDARAGRGRRVARRHPGAQHD
jgi:hypothetical protein